MSLGLCLGTKSSMSRDAAARRVRTPVWGAIARDHAAIQCFLSGIFPQTTPAEFRAALEEPSYRPADRLLIRRHSRIIAHAQTARRSLQLGAVQLPAGTLGAMATAEDMRGRGLGMHLLAAAERHLIERGAVVALLRTAVPYGAP